MYCLYRKSLFYHVKKGYFFIAAFLLIFFFFFLYLNSLNQISFCTSPLNFQFKVPVFMFQMLLGPCSKNWIFLLRLLTFSLSWKWRWLKMLFENFQYYCLFPLRPWLFLYRILFRSALVRPYKQYEIYIF